MGVDIPLWPALAALAGAYLVGSVPCGVLLTRAAGLGDIRQIGSGNIGATNVLRAGNKWVALLTLLADVVKGAVPVLVLRELWPDETLLHAVAGSFAMLGHLFPVWLRFRGGKGVSTLAGVLLALSWPAGLLAVATWLAVVAVSRYASLAALTATALGPVYAWFYTDPATAGIIAAAVLVVWQRHHENIRRLLRGEESKIGQRG